MRGRQAQQSNFPASCYGSPSPRGEGWGEGERGKLQLQSHDDSRNRQTSLVARQSRRFPNMSMKITGVEAIILESPKDYGVDAHEAAGPRYRSLLRVSTDAGMKRRLPAETPISSGSRPVIRLLSAGSVTGALV